ncbi:DUF1934 domain-containing protein [Cohnella caldifontis]|uniref:DUF1934 domain-containing protein n=1 Tax=Cohnella caldifontis TaxID=3027471 RepID=UPI0023EB9D3B|nr:DUF1934 domain-containing protein [Cohnella sp. YIM B05605]
MPDAARVSASLRIRRDGGAVELAAAGQLHRLLHGWALTCRLQETGRTADAPQDDSPASEMMLILREDEIRMNRKGEIAQDQVFRVGEWKAGTIGTRYGTLRAEAYTTRIEMDLLPGGGSVEWEYDWRTADRQTERCSVRLEIREEVAK